MFSVLKYPAALFPATAPRNPGSSITWSPTSLLKGPTSSEGYIKPLVRLLRTPAATLDKVLEELNPPPSQDVSQVEERENRRKLLYLKLRNADAFEEWRAAAFELDELEGNNAWKSEVQSSEYDFKLLESQLRQLDEARTARNQSRMLFLIRTSLARHPGGIQNLKLYKHTHLGTKELIERYIRSVLDTLSALLEISYRNKESGIEHRLLLENVLAARQAFGRSALLLSGGGTYGMNHIGVVKSLWEAKLLPRIVSGASAGSIVCAVLCARTDEEMPAVMDQFCYGNLAVFTREGEDGLSYKLSRFLKFGAIFDIENLIGVMRELIGDMTFQEAYNRTRRILNICVSTASLFELPRLLNYVTAPNVIIWSAVAASCSVPFIFSPASLSAKDPKTGEIVPWNPSPQRWIDGSVDNDLPMTRLAEMFNVNHFIVSQVNPHVVPFLNKEEDQVALQANTQNSVVRMGSEWMTNFANLAKDEALHRMQLLAEVGIVPNILIKTRSILSQKYSGDITILPELSLAHLPKVLVNPTTDFMLSAMLCGERATWPKLSRIQNHCAIELALDDAVQQLRAWVAFSPSQVDLRLSSVPRPLSRAGSEGGKSRKGKRKSQHASKNPGMQRRKTVFETEPVVPPMILTKESNVVRPLASAPPFSKTEPGKAPAVFSLSIPGEQGDDADADEDTLSSSSSFSPSDSEITAAEDYFSSSTGDEAHSTPPMRHLFPHQSQPVTPYQHGQHSYFSTPKSSSNYRPPTPAHPSSQATQSSKTPSNLTMTTTPSPAQNSPSQISTKPAADTQYKSSVHQSRPQHQSTAESMPQSLSMLTSVHPSRSNPSRRGSRSNSISRSGSVYGSGTTTPRPLAVALPSETDVAAMNTQRKRSLSNGIRGLRPPSFSNG